MAKYQYNLAVIGAGSAGLVSSYVAAAAKAKVALIERHKMGIIVKSRLSQYRLCAVQGADSFGVFYARYPPRQTTGFQARRSRV